MLLTNMKMQKKLYKDLLVRKQSTSIRAKSDDLSPDKTENLQHRMENRKK